MELQQLTEQMLLAVTSLNRSCIPQSVQEPLKGENFLLDYLSAQNGCSTPGALREVLGVSAPRTAAMLRALGAQVTVRADGLTVCGRPALTGGTVDPEDGSIHDALTGQYIGLADRYLNATVCAVPAKN